MSGTWFPDEAETPYRPGIAGWILVVMRGIPLAVLVFGGLAVLLLVRQIERPLCGVARPVTPHITRLVCRGAFVVLGMGFSTRGRVMREKGAIVSNHASWLDIFSLNAAKCIYFVAKSEVAGWPGIGWLARATGTVFIARRARDAKQHLEVFENRLNLGHKLLFFPEGTSTDGLRVIPFKSTLFQAFFAQNLVDTMHIQPVTVKYTAPKAQEARFYGWWGDMELVPHLVKTLSVRHPGSVTVIYHAPVAVRDFANRKALAAYCEATVRAGLD
jgi:1-acyl-sn-glycerol-3-phosphate acyltransferase